MLPWDDLTSLTLTTHHVLGAGLWSILNSKANRRSYWPEQQEPNKTYHKPPHGMFFTLDLY